MRAWGRLSPRCDHSASTLRRGSKWLLGSRIRTRCGASSLPCGAGRTSTVTAPEVRSSPDATGHFGPYGGRFVPETLVHALDQLAAEYARARSDPAFASDLEQALRDFAGRPSPLVFAPQFSKAAHTRVFLKREDLLHTGAHKINNTIGQCLLARRMGKPRVIAETGAGQHGVATAAAAARCGLTCTIYMGVEDARRQHLNVQRMQLLGAEVREVESGSRTLKDAINEALRDWVTRVDDTHYVLGSVLGPHPFPTLVRDFQRVIGVEARAQFAGTVGGLADVLVACVGGGSNAIGLFHAFLDEPSVRKVGVEAGGLGIASGRHASRTAEPTVGVLHGTRTLVLQDERGMIRETHSVSAGLDYPALGPEHAWLRDQGMVEYTHATDAEALDAFEALSRLEGILPALETAHALAWVLREGKTLGRERNVVVGLSGRGDKDVEEVLRVRGAGRS
ncbi:MAG: tryptophan synthase subunit beta [Candidatus Eisenbacteria bacterium]|uniref:Tryptophan synthase beta chain n=1 Tax=Eiseniibacteriota bacterium TaxID=2212470 RepID=A0A538TXN8_UNCEI|nr:MAG: tryptophan synthase subunit beta [Candidatus Eisenbacteria bacterium]